MQAFGAPQHVIDEVLSSVPDEDFEVLPENWEAVCLFMRCQTQWKFPPMGGQPLGLDYPGVRVVLESASPAGWAVLFEQVQVIEFAALEAWREKG